MPQAVGTKEGINDIYFRDKEAGFLLAGNTIFVTRDDGARWEVSRSFLSSEFEGAQVELYSVRFSSKKKGWVVGSVSRGDLVIGPIDAKAAQDTALAARLQALVELFATAQVPVRVSADVMAELWSKLMVNCAYNAISGIAQASYGKLTALGPVRELQEAVVREVVALAEAEGVNLTLAPALEAMRKIAGAMPAQLSSTAQDMARGKPSEIDHLNGFVARRGAALGVATPANQALHALVRLIESERGRG